jgi:hypothetical protein
MLELFSSWILTKLTLLLWLSGEIFSKLQLHDAIYNLQPRQLWLDIWYWLLSIGSGIGKELRVAHVTRVLGKGVAAAENVDRRISGVYWHLEYPLHPPHFCKLKLSSFSHHLISENTDERRVCWCRKVHLEHSLVDGISNAKLRSMRILAHTEYNRKFTSKE